MTNYNEYDINPSEVNKFQKENKSVTEGVLCPKRNRSIEGNKCAVCERVQKLFSTGDPRDKEIALDKMAKCTYYVNAVLPENPNELVIVEIPKKAGDAIIEGMKIKGWNDIANPYAGKGRLMVFTKTKGSLGFNQYSADPALKNEDWDVPEEVLSNIPNIVDDPIGSVEKAIIDGNLFKVSSIKLDESVKIRILPWSSDASIKTPIGIIFRHWGVTQDEVDGVVEMDLTTMKEKFDKKKENEESGLMENKLDISRPETKKEETSEPSEKSKAPSCFGIADFFDPQDKACYEKCKVFEICKSKVIES